MKSARNITLGLLFFLLSSGIFSAHYLNISSGSENETSDIIMPPEIIDISSELIKATQALCEYPAEHNLSPRERSLQGADLSHKDLRFADLEGFNLDMADLRESQMDMASAIKISLRQSNLSGSQMPLANFFGADFSGANVEGADFSGAQFCQANLYGVNLSLAKLNGADLTFAICKETSDLPKYVHDIGCKFFDKEALKRAGARFNEVLWTQTKEGAELLNAYKEVISKQVIAYNSSLRENEGDLALSKSTKSLRQSLGKASSLSKNGSFGKRVRSMILTPEILEKSFKAQEENIENVSSNSHRNSLGKSSNHNSFGQRIKARYRPEESPRKEGDSLSKGSVKPTLIRTSSKSVLSQPPTGFNKKTSGSRADFYKSNESQNLRRSVIGFFPPVEENP
jgi:hypothetical protein